LPMRSVFYLLASAPYGCEKAFGLLNAAAVSLGKMEVTVGLYGDGVYLALGDQDSKGLGVPNLAEILRAYGEVGVLAHEPSVVERGLFGEGLVETVGLADEEAFLDAIEGSDCLIML
jgi:tRNA 2-thiouridine synthesizing protein C